MFYPHVSKHIPDMKPDKLIIQHLDDKPLAKSELS